MTKEDFVTQYKEFKHIFEECEKIEDLVAKVFRESKYHRECNFFNEPAMEACALGTTQLILRAFNDGDVCIASDIATDALYRSDISLGIFNFKEMCEPKKLDEEYLTGYIFDTIAKFYSEKHQEDDWK